MAQRGEQAKGPGTIRAGHSVRATASREAPLGCRRGRGQGRAGHGDSERRASLASQMDSPVAHTTGHHRSESRPARGDSAPEGCWRLAWLAFRRRPRSEARVAGEPRQPGPGDQFQALIYRPDFGRRSGPGLCSNARKTPRKRNPKSVPQKPALGCLSLGQSGRRPARPWPCGSGPI